MLGWAGLAPQAARESASVSLMYVKCSIRFLSLFFFGDVASHSVIIHGLVRGILC